MKSWIKRIVLALVIVLILTVAGFVAWASFPLGPGTIAAHTLQSDAQVTVETIQGWTVFRPTNGETQIGFIFYPGGRVDYRSYAPLLKPLAEQGYLVVLTPMPLSMAFFAPDTADAVLAAFPDIQTWAIGGHSLGGAMAARYCYTHPGTMQALALWASFPASTDSLRDRSLAVLSIYGTQDGAVDKIETSGNLLPKKTTWVKIEGGSHAQFGDYGLQPGDGTAQISPQEQWRQVVSATLALLQSISPK